MTVKAPLSRAMHLLSTCDVGGHSDTLQIMVEGGHAFVTHPFSGGFSVVDIRDPTAPRTVAHRPPPPGSMTLHLQLHEGILLVASEADMSSRAAYLDKAGYFGAQLGYDAADVLGDVGVQVYDVSHADNPVEIAFCRLPGFGVHRLFWAGGAVATASEMPLGQTDFALTVLDMADPVRPTVRSRWVPPDMSDPTVTGSGRIGLHHAILGGGGSGDTALAYGAWRAGGLQIVDVRGEPELIGALAPQAWGGGNTHTTLPLSSRNLVVVADESVVEGGADGRRRIVLVDVADPRDPQVISTLPEPGEQAFRDLAAVFGPHNLHENRPGTWQSDELIFATYQSAGVRAYDVSDPAAPVEVGYLVPPPPTAIHDPRTPGAALVAQTADLLALDDGMILASDLNSGLSIMQFDGR